MLKNINIGYKLTLMVAIPILGLLYFTIANTIEKLEIVNEMNSLEEWSELAVKSSLLIHELQNERGMSAGFLGSRGVKFSAGIKAQRHKTDNAIKGLDKFLRGFNFKKTSKEIKNNMDTIFSKLNKITFKRNLVDKLDISVVDELRYYTAIINSLLKGINHLSKIITNTELSNLFTTYANLLQVKEKAGVERATLNNIFGQGHFAPDMYRNFILLVGTQNIYTENFFFFATPHQKQIYQHIMQGEFVDEVTRIRDIAFKKASKFRLLANLHSHLGYEGLIQPLTDYIHWGKPEYISAFNHQYQSASTILAIYKKLSYVSPADFKKLETIQNTLNIYKEYLTTAITLKNQNKSVDEISAIIEIDEAPAIKALNRLLSGDSLDIEPTYWWKIATGRINLFKTLEDNISQDLQAYALTLKKNAQTAFISYLTISGVTIILTFFLSFILARGITKPLKTLVKVADQISSGNRNIAIAVESSDETGQLANAMAQMLRSITRSEAIQQREINERKQAEIMLKETNQAYARFVPNEFLQLLNKNNIVDIQLGNNVKMNMTVLFSDLRSFTTLSENMSPQENFNFINAYLKEMEPIIRRHNGFIDKFIGDAIMALFIKADDALNASLTMLQKLDNFNQEFSQIKIGIGLNTGELMLGIIGEQNRLQCTVISDAVNLASRLENLTKTYKSTLIISEETFLNLTDPYQNIIRFLDNIKVKGRTERVNIFEVFDCDEPQIREKKLATLPIFEEAVSLYQVHCFSKAKKLMQKCLDKNPHDAAAEVYLQRCQNFLNVDHSEAWEEIGKIMKRAIELSIGNSTIDNQHRELFIRVKNLIMSIGSGKADEEVHEIIGFLEDYVITHFETEEKYMLDYNYPKYAAHKTEHTQFIKTFQQIKEDYNSKKGHLYLALQIQHYTINWLDTHINKTDKELGLFLKNKVLTG